MRKTLLLLFLGFELVSCSGEKSGQNEEALTANNDTIITSSVVIFLSPDDKEIQELKKKHGEDNFYTIADDANNYSSEAFELLNKRGTHYIFTEKRNFSFPNEKHNINKDNIKECKWVIIEYTIGSKPTVYCPIDYISKLREDQPSELSSNGTWVKDCNSSDMLSIEEIAGGQLNFVEKYSLNTSVEASNNGSYYLKYKFPTALIPAPEYSWNDFSKDSVIAKLVLTSSTKAEFFWYGFYNEKTKKREVLETGFANVSPNKPIELINSQVECK